MAKAIMFDYDGVIVDSFNAVFLSWKELTDKYDSRVKIINSGQLKKIWVNNVVELLNLVGLPKTYVDEQLKVFIKYINKNPPKVFEGIKETLRKLSKDYTLLLVSGCSFGIINKKLREEGIFDLFKLIVPIIKPEKNKPNPFHINFALKKLDLNPKEVIYVGDTPGDMEAAINAGIDKIILVSYGFSSRESLKSCNPSKIVDSPNEILNAVDKLK